MLIEQPYILFLGEAKSLQDAKTAYGIFKWNPDSCLAQYCYDNCTISLDLPQYSFAEAKEKGAKTLVIGIANQGGFLTKQWINTIVEAIENGLNIASGMHMRLNSIPEILAASKKNNVKLYDIRHYNQELPVGNGKKRTGKRILTVGTDCNIGKMFSSLAIAQEMKSRGYDCTFRATGQTGILISGGGIPVDAIVSDFISGAIETLAPDNNEHHFDIIEGQGSLLHASYAGVSLGLLHGSQPDYLVLCHEPKREFMRHLDYKMPDIQEVIDLNLTCARLTNKNAKFIGICLNLSSITDMDEKLKIKTNLEDKYQLPVCDPMQDGTGIIIDQITR